MSIKTTNYENLQRYTAHIMETYAEKGNIVMNDLASALQSVITGKADAATTLAGYGITDAMTSTEITNAISAAISSTYKPGGSLTAAEILPALLVVGNEGKVYNASEAFTTTSDFVEGAGKTHPAGTNIVVINTAASGETAVYKFDVLAGFIDLSGYSTTQEMNTAIATAIADKIELTDISVASASGSGNVITALSYDNTNGVFTPTKGITALQASDFEAFTNAEMDALWTSSGE